MKRSCAALALLTLVPTVACAEWLDNFDSYSPGGPNGTGGWKGWDNFLAAFGIISTAHARSAPNSMEIGLGADAVRTRTGVNSGQWRYTASWWVPSDFAGTSCFLLLNVYTDLGPYQWSLQMAADGCTGTVLDVDTAIRPGAPGYGTGNGVLNNDDFFFYILIFAAGC